MRYTQSTHRGIYIYMRYKPYHRGKYFFISVCPNGRLFTSTYMCLKHIRMSTYQQTLNYPHKHKFIRTHTIDEWYMVETRYEVAVACPSVDNMQCPGLQDLVDTCLPVNEATQKRYRRQDKFASL